MTRYAIGIDTGGTYTDAALIDAGARTVLAKAKALTTKGDLSIGVTEALDRVLDAAGSDAGSNGHGVSGADIALVSLSTTLATNAIVEGHGSAIGVILAGFDDKMAERTEIARAIPGVRILRVSGGHDHAGNEAEKLDEAAVAAFLRETGGAVEAYAVASHYSVRNPAHERRVRALAAELTGRPTTLSSDLAHALDAPRRALTAALNARIIARIVALVAAVRVSMHRHGVDAPLMIVKGDGTLADADAVAQRPIETILSGPAASVIGAKFLSGLADFVISDIGGTTTDVAVLENGWPKLDRSGAIVGGRRTLVRAIDMRTFGLGGDSEVDFENDGRVALRTNRIVPASLLASRHPSVLRHMRRVLADPEGEPYAGRFLVRPFGHDGGAVAAELTVRERDMLDLVQGEPIPMKDAVKGPSNHRALDRLVGLGLLQVSGFTPSDAAHVLGLQGQWLREGAVLAGALFKRWRRMSPPSTPAMPRRSQGSSPLMSSTPWWPRDRPRHSGDAGGRSAGWLRRAAGRGGGEWRGAAARALSRHRPGVAGGRRGRSGGRVLPAGGRAAGLRHRAARAWRCRQRGGRGGGRGEGADSGRDLLAGHGRVAHSRRRRADPRRRSRRGAGPRARHGRGGRPCGRARHGRDAPRRRGSH